MSRAVLITPTITINAIAYSAGDSIGGKIALNGASRANFGASILDSLMILDRANQKAVLEVLIFDSDPSAATLTNNAAFVFSTDDVKVLARIPVATADYITINGKAVAMLRNLGAIVKPVAGSTLYAAIITTGTPTYAVGDVQIRFGFLVN
jgi:hypothetical protein